MFVERLLLYDAYHSLTELDNQWNKTENKRGSIVINAIQRIVARMVAGDGAGIC